MRKATVSVALRTGSTGQGAILVMGLCGQVGLALTRNWRASGIVELIETIETLKKSPGKYGQCLK
jgi:hypothetical protein